MSSEWPRLMPVKTVEPKTKAVRKVIEIGGMRYRCTMTGGSRKWSLERYDDDDRPHWEPCREPAGDAVMVALLGTIKEEATRQ